MKPLIHLFIFFISLGLLAGCGASPSMEISVSTEQPFQPNVEIPLALLIEENGEPLSGWQISAVFEMEKMDHGSVDVTFTELENGKYQGMGTFPMGGDWVAYVTLAKGEEIIEKTIPISLKES